MFPVEQSRDLGGVAVDYFKTEKLTSFDQFDWLITADPR
jgi:hypothetical protein